ncbi:putative glutamate receptor [Nymphon striatum]|nr:putative glutamate receptor [Nymphon striatum]
MGRITSSRYILALIGPCWNTGRSVARDVLNMVCRDTGWSADSVPTYGTPHSGLQQTVWPPQPAVHHLQGAELRYPHPCLPNDGLNKSGTKVIIKYAYSDYKNEIARTAIMGYWQLNSGLRNVLPFSRCCYNLTEYPIKIVYVKIEAEPKNAFGGLDQHSKPTGLFKFLALKHADIVLCPVAYTEDRRTVADFTVSVFQENTIGLYKPLATNSDFWSFYVKPFSMYSWILILTLILFLMLFSVMLMRYFPNTGVRNSNTFDMLAICGLLLNQGSSHYHSSVGWRMYYWSVTLLGTLLVTFYGSKIVAEYAVLKHTEFFNDFYEVANHPLYRPIVLKDSAIFTILKSSADPEVCALWNRMKKDINHYTVTSLEQSIEQVDCCHGVYIGPSSYIKYVKSQNPSLVILDRSLGNFPMGFALQKNSPLTRIFNSILNYLHEGGIVQHIKNDNFNISSKSKETKIVKQIVLSEMRFPITFIATAIILTIMLCFIEMIWVKHNLSK